MKINNQFQGWEITVWVFEQIARFLWAKERFALLSLLSLFKKVRWSKERRELYALWHQKGKNRRKIRFFSANRACFLSGSFCKERFTHGHSFLKSDESDSLTVARFQRATRENRSQLLFKMSNFERMRERANYQPWPITTTFASPSMMQGRNWGQGTKTHIRRRWRREEAGRVYCRSSDQMYTIEWTQGLGEVGEPSWFMERG